VFSFRQKPHKPISKQEKELREEARQIISEIVDRVCSTHGYSYNRIAIKNTRSRLGSCSSKMNLNFNWQIIKFPKNIMEYVIKHEVAHLKHQNHSKNFWQEVEKLDPDYKANHKWIRQNAHKYLKF